MIVVAVAIAIVKPWASGPSAATPPPPATAPPATVVVNTASSTPAELGTAPSRL